MLESSCERPSQSRIDVVNKVANIVPTLLFSTLLVGLTGCANPIQAPVVADPTAAAPAPAPAPAPAAVTPPEEPAAGTPAHAVPTGPETAATFSLLTQDTNVTGVAADFIECKRKEGVLSVKIRLRNTSPAQVNMNVIKDHNYSAFYVTAADKKYFMLKDSEGVYLTPAADANGSLTVPIPAAGQYTWWAMFPAPPPSVKRIILMTPMGAPFTYIQITD
jgi:hypothetical protein